MRTISGDIPVQLFDYVESRRSSKERGWTRAKLLWRIIDFWVEHGAPNLDEKRGDFIFFTDKHREYSAQQVARVLLIGHGDLDQNPDSGYTYIVTKDVKALEGDMGNSERVLFQHYIRPVPLADGLRFRGLILHYSTPRAASAMGTGPKPRRERAAE
jgi:hypothetical protein